ncbi:MAG: 50S ribosomal protein L21 [Firmicutes bacterium]|nr:50S ribosomal protein L21 [Bacillota bacterium]
MYAVIATGGKQYRVQPGDIITVEKLPYEPEDTVEFEEVLLVADGERVKVGDPVLSGIKVTAKVLEQGKGPKIHGLKFKPKKRYRRRYGHRQRYTKVQIQSIVV